MNLRNKVKATGITNNNIWEIRCKLLDPNPDNFLSPNLPRFFYGFIGGLGMIKINIGNFPSCKFNLCISCYSGFHNVTDSFAANNIITHEYSK